MLNAANTACTVGPNLCVADLIQHPDSVPIRENLRLVTPDRVVPLTFGLRAVTTFPSVYLSNFY